MKIGPLQCDFKKRFYVMGILNVTPDSFSDGGAYHDPERAMDRVREMIAHGVDIIDIGGESTRPGAPGVSLEEELRRVQPVLKKIRQESNIPLSIDTRKAEVAQRALEAGTDMVNDVSAATFDPEMVSVVKKWGVPLVVMHSRGDPKTMASLADYGDVVLEVVRYLRQRVLDLTSQGVPFDKLILDPGLGFAKKPEHNWQILHRLELLCQLPQPILIGHSNKSFISNILGNKPHQLHDGNIAVAVLARMKGAGMIRVHEVASMVRVRRVMEAYEGGLRE
ncbi:MAG: dihydropteroate synthase [Deltaproteobacteria bacterium RIFCSPHIGHO2_02_FULL_50_15]|nr:MAG: dihydropteroate synthase [Deltaproteobacteria bacterium RIFCSPHIGHO2_02_FULL_50_15]